MARAVNLPAGAIPIRGLICFFLQIIVMHPSNKANKIFTCR